MPSYYDPAQYPNGKAANPSAGPNTNYDSVQAIPYANKSLYTYTPNGSGGINYFYGSTPIRNTVYAAATGTDTNALEAGAKPKTVSASSNVTSTPSGGASYSGGGGGYSTAAVSAAPAFDPAAIAYYDDQINQANGAISRLANQRTIGNENINGSFNSALNQLTGNNALQVRNYNTQKQQTIDDNVNARAKVDANVSRQSQGLRNLLGNSSSAALFAAPLAVARSGTQQQGEIQTSYGRNISALDTSNDDRERQFQAARGDLDTQTAQSRNALEAGLQQSEASILESLSNLQVQKAQAKGQNYAQARGVVAPINSRIQNILSSIDNLGRNPAIAARDISYTAPNLEQYKVGNTRIDASQPQNALQQLAGQYYGLLGSDDDKRKGLL